MSDQIQIRRKTRYTTIDNPILHDNRVGLHDLVVYLVLSRFANGDAQAWPSYATLADMARISRRKAIDTVKNLEKLGYIVKTEEGDSKGKTNRYFLVDQWDLHESLGLKPMAQDAIPGAQHAPPSAHGAPDLVHGVHLPSAHGAPEVSLKKYKENNSAHEEGQTSESRLIKKFYNTHQEITKTLVPMTGPEFGNARDVIAAMGEEKALACVQAYFDPSKDWWFTRKKGSIRRVYSWAGFYRNLSEIVSQLSSEPKAPELTVLRVCPHCGAKRPKTSAGYCSSCGEDYAAPVAAQAGAL